MKSIFSTIFAIFAINLISAPIELGMEAPEIEIIKWVKNGPVKLADGKGKNVYIIEFWATWCPPCRMSIPHLSKLQKKYKEQGLVVVGITKEELSTVEPFVKNQKNMEYNVGVDIEGEIYNKYMQDVKGIPHAFIINKEGVVAWSGHPLEIDATLEDVMNGTFNVEAQKRVSELHKELKGFIQSGNNEKALQTAKEILLIDPEHIMAMQIFIYISSRQNKIPDSMEFLDTLITQQPAKSRPYMVKLSLLNDLGDTKAIKSLAIQYIEQFQDNPTKLNSIAWALINDIPFGKQPLKEALEASRKAVELTPTSDNMLTAAHLDTLARCYYAVGRIDKAIIEQEKATSMVKGTEEELMFKNILEFYKKAQELGNK